MQKTLFFLLITISAFAMADDLNVLWQNWKLTYNKTYTPDQEQIRFGIFCDNYNTITQWNAGSQNVKLAINKFADRGAQEFTNQHSNCLMTNGGGSQSGFLELFVLDDFGSDSDSDTVLPPSVDWRTTGAVTPVKDQGYCNSCWAFAAVGALESLYFIKNNKTEIFSEQNLIDCDMNEMGCQGGRVEGALGYTSGSGLELLSDYPYINSDEECYADKKKAFKVNKSFNFIHRQDPQSLKAALVKQPVAVALQADSSVFQFYDSGVVSGAICSGNNLNFAGLAVGYTTINGVEAFIVKISWGSDWGQEGYIYISTSIYGDLNGPCGILGNPVAPTI